MNSGIQRLTAKHIFNGSQFISDKVIIVNEQGRIVDVISTKDAGEEVKRFEGVLCPGFVNAHCHIELSHLTGKIPEHTGLVDFLITVTKKRNDLDREEIIYFSEKADREMFETGIVAVGDIANNTNSIGVKKNSLLYYHTFVEVIGFLNFNAKERFSWMEEIFREFSLNLLPASIVPHAPYSVSKTIFRLINNYDPEAIVSIHNQETENENLLYETGMSEFSKLYDSLGLDISEFKPTHRSSLKSWLPFFDHGQQLILVHNTFTDESDIEFAEMQNNKIFWCLCPNANLYIENKLPRIELLLKHQAKIVLGTDSLASNKQLSILEEMKTLHQYVPSLRLETMLGWATANGAAALGCEHTFGNFTIGSTPGILQIDGLEINPAGDFILKENSSVKRIV